MTAAELRDANDAVGLTLLEDYDVGAQDLLKRSDNWPFVAHGIPALFLTTGLHPDYHTPRDEPENIDYLKLTRMTQWMYMTGWIVGNAAKMCSAPGTPLRNSETMPVPSCDSVWRGRPTPSTPPSTT